MYLYTYIYMYIYIIYIFAHAQICIPRLPQGQLPDPRPLPKTSQNVTTVKFGSKSTS